MSEKLLTVLAERYYEPVQIHLSRLRAKHFEESIRIHQ